MKPLLVGELNPYGSDPKYALYPVPDRSAGHNLCTRVMGLGRREYLRSFERANLCEGRWSAPVARARAGELLVASVTTPLSTPLRRLVLCGAKVADAFGLDYRPFTRTHIGDSVAVVLLPHPSGICRLWNEPYAYDRARALLVASDVLPAPKLSRDARLVADAVSRVVTALDLVMSPVCSLDVADVYLEFGRIAKERRPAWSADVRRAAFETDFAHLEAAGLVSVVERGSTLTLSVLRVTYVGRVALGFPVVARLELAKERG